ncbi:MAG: peptide chain release factor 3 [Thermoanaerobaculia bacterium]
MSNRSLEAEIARRRTFAIISHPDAGKTTLTEKLLLYGGAIHLAGSVKLRRAASRHTTSDWMDLERERGISVTTSVLQFEYRGHHVNLLDTPGHNDFSEDTYRTLAAADCVVMLIDSAKGVEPQTVKLFEVCRMRRLPIVTFINKLDRSGQDPMDLLDEIEKVLGIPCSPVSWPIGSGPDFQGIYDRWSRELIRYERGEKLNARPVPQGMALDDPAFIESIGADAHRRLSDEIALLDAAGNKFDRDAFLRGEVTPVFFGSAMNDFGVEPFLVRFLDLAPAPIARETASGRIEPAGDGFSGFVFKIQANMDPAHRDRIAFLRICSGRFTRGMEVRHVRTGKPMKLTKPLQFLAQERTLIEEAFAGDILGLWDSGSLRIGDSLAEKTLVEFDGIPRFSPEHFVRVALMDPLKRKQLKKGLDQLSEEGAVQVFYDPVRLERDPILGAVGVLQFEVIQYRLRMEYGAEVSFARLPYLYARWVEGDGFVPARFDDPGRTACLFDLEGRPLVLFESEWAMQRAIKENPKLRFIAAVQPGRAVANLG